MKKYQVENHEESWLPEGDWEMVWSDEFDGTELDRSKWDYRLHMMGTRWPAWTDQGVHLDGNGNCVFTLTMNEEGKPVSSQLQTGYNFMDQPVEKTTFGKEHLQWQIGKLKESMFLHGPGYYECRCRLHQKEGWWVAFWIQSPIIGASLNTAETGVEIDVLESVTPGNVQHHNVFTGGYGLDNKHAKVGGVDEISTDEYHRFGVLWDETGYTFYVDGVEDGKITEYLTTRPEFILISTEVLGYRYEDHKPVKEAYDNQGDTFVVDYVRVFEKR